MTTAFCTYSGPNSSHDSPSLSAYPSFSHFPLGPIFPPSRSCSSLPLSVPPASSDSSHSSMGCCRAVCPKTIIYNCICQRMQVSKARWTCADRLATRYGYIDLWNIFSLKRTIISIHPAQARHKGHGQWRCDPTNMRWTSRGISRAI